jgi:hypothetical protein
VHGELDDADSCSLGLGAQEVAQIDAVRVNLDGPEIFNLRNAERFQSRSDGRPVQNRGDLALNAVAHSSTSMRTS